MVSLLLRLKFKYFDTYLSPNIQEQQRIFSVIKWTHPNLQEKCQLNMGMFDKRPFDNRSFYWSMSWEISRGYVNKFVTHAEQSQMDLIKYYHGWDSIFSSD